MRSNEWIVVETEEGVKMVCNDCGGNVGERSQQHRTETLCYVGVVKRRGSQKGSEEEGVGD